MKTLLRLFLVAFALVAAVSCAHYDDTEILNEIAGIKERLDKLETQVNNNISGLWEIVNALNNKVTVESVTETDDAWIIAFSGGKTVTVSKDGAGQSPVVGVKQDTDGVYYWTLDGDWLLDGKGGKIPVSGKDGEDGATPKFKIEGDYWYLSTDGGKTWSKLCVASTDPGDGMIKNVTFDDSFVCFTLADGTVLRLGRGSGGALAITAVPDYADGSVQAVKDIFTIRFDVYPESAADELAALGTDIFKLKVVYTYPTKAGAGQSTTLPIVSKEGLNGVLIVTVDGSGLADEFINGTLGANASLSVVYMENGMTSGYFPLKFFDSLNGHEYVDLGLPSGTKWASMNVGADNPEDPGDFYAWGEVEPYYEPGHALDDPCTAWKPGKEAGYEWHSYRWCEGADMTLTKYNDDPSVGKVDHKIILDPEDDAATAKWGGYWRMPTRTELLELKNSCTWTKTTRKGVEGYLATPKNGGQALFFPYSGFRNDTRLGKNSFYVWSSTRRLSKSSLVWPEQEQGICFLRSKEGEFGVGSGVRDMGYTIRPVYGKYLPVQAIEVTPSTIQLKAGEKTTLTATIVPSNATEPTILWESTDESIATVDENGNVTAIADGITYIVAWSSNGLSSSCAVTVGAGPVIVEPDYVDLGLSVKWATFNLGANKQEGLGDYYAWGETEPYYEPGTAMSPIWKKGKEAGYAWPSYKWSDATGSTFYKYNSNSIYGSKYGKVDYKFNLEPEDDAAAGNLGGDWRMPTFSELRELQDNCSFEHSQKNGVDGILLTSKVPGYTDKSIFLPCAGNYFEKSLTGINKWADIWSSYISEQCVCAQGITSSNSQSVNFSLFDASRRSGKTIRPVHGKFIPVETFSLNTTEIVLKVGDYFVPDHVISPSNASEKSLMYFPDDEKVVRYATDRIYANGEGSTYVTAVASNGMSAKFKVTVKAGEPMEPEYVDLGLSVKWATFNLGARKPEDFGDYFAWGETEPYYEPGTKMNLVWKKGKEAGYDWLSYKWYDQDSHEITKYNIDRDSGPVDHKFILDPEDDAATANWGENWRTPTPSEFDELMENCYWDWTDNYENTGVEGHIIYSLVPGYEGNSIFLPAAGYATEDFLNASIASYWMSHATWAYEGGKRDNRYSYLFAIQIHDAAFMAGERYFGLTVRPVYGKLVPVTSFSLSPANMELAVGESIKITKTILPDNATEKMVFMESSNTSVVEVDLAAGTVLGAAEGSATIIGYASNGLSATCTITVKGTAEQQPKYVDLGLGVKWATFNVGATKPEEPGDYFAWGETTPYYESGYAISDYPVWLPGKEAGYDWPSYKWCDGAWDKLNKYCTDSYYGKVDNSTVLEPKDDAARANWGMPWRMPTKADMEELLNPANCEWEWTSEGGMPGYRVTSKIPGYTTQSIFLPAAGRRIELAREAFGETGFYLTSTLSATSTRTDIKELFEACMDDPYSWADEDRCYGFSVRPVCE